MQAMTRLMAILMSVFVLTVPAEAQRPRPLGWAMDAMRSGNWDAAAALAAEMEKADVTAAVPALRSTVENLRKSPVRIVIPDAALESLAALAPEVFDDAKAQELILQIIDELKLAPPASNFGYRLLEAVIKNPDPQLLHRSAPFICDCISSLIFGKP